MFEVEGLEGQLYDYQRLLRAVGNRTQLPAVELCSSLIAEVQEFSATQEFNDDVCLVAMDIVAVPQWLPRGSMVKIHTEHGVLAYIAADEGRGVEARHAAKESGKTEEQKAASVLDFCAAEQLWPDFVIVEIYYYAGKIPFSELSIDEQRTLFAYAMEYVIKRE